MLNNNIYVKHATTITATRKNVPNNNNYSKNIVGQPGIRHIDCEKQ